MAKGTEHIFLQLNQRLSNVEKIVKKVQRDVDDKLLGIDNMKGSINNIKVTLILLIVLVVVMSGVLIFS